MKSTIKIYIYVFLISVLIVSCKNEEPVKLNKVLYFKVAESVTSGASFDVNFYSTDSLFVGYNNVFFTITDKNTGLSVDHATIVMHPLMDMVTSYHGCPVENPKDSLTSEGYFKGAILFSMPGVNSWSLNVDISANGKSEKVLLQINKVKSTNPLKKMVVTDSLSTGFGTWIITKYPICLVEPKIWKEGNNPFEITVNTMESMMSFPYCTDLTIIITPEMPSMGHGSPNNVNPVSMGNGHYLGVVNFTMTGAWRVNMNIKKGERIISNKTYFDIVF